MQASSPPYVPKPAKKEGHACVSAFQRILASTVTDRSTFLCPYEQGFVDVKDQECCPADLVLYSWSLASLDPACAKQQLVDPAVPTATCNGQVVSQILVGDATLCWTAEEGAFRPCARSH
jgi:hypothetical protein